MNKLTIGNLEVHYEVVQLSDGSWRASVTSLSSVELASGRGSAAITAEGNSADVAARYLEEKIKRQFTISIEAMSPWQALAAVVKWIWVGRSPQTKLLRVLAITGILLVVSILTVDYQKLELPVVKNVRWLSGGEKVEIEAGFFDEGFFQKSLDAAKQRFWACGISFRNLVTGNKSQLAALTKRDVQLKLVLLDPDSPLARPELIEKISRTATQADIRQTVQRLVGQDGILENGGNQSRQEIWLSDLAPVIPMVVVDDTIYVSFLKHVDRARTQSAYGTSYLKVPVRSSLGKSLLEHFSNMVDQAKRISLTSTH